MGDSSSNQKDIKLMASDNMDKINEILTSYEDNTKAFTNQDQQVHQQTHNNNTESTMDAEPQSTEELAAYIQNTLSNLQNKFTTISDGILNRVDTMAVRIDSLEKSIAELMTASGVDMNDVSLPNERK